MQTQSHFLMTAAALTPLRQRPWLGATEVAGLLTGAVLPDLPFFVLTLGGEAYYRWIATPPPTAIIMEYLHFTLFYTDPLWIGAHNFFHSLLINSALLVAGWWGWRRRGSRVDRFVFWAAVAMLIHVFIDIFTHHSDGPLILFPVDWNYRYSSPISYWESGAGGQTFFIFEIILNLVLVAYLAVAYWPTIRRRWRRKTPAPSSKR
ncbi:metal-dependent hydrolase [Caldilinea sp.]|uniref:metal-dependent hydrolase n=1 Tax=Caldilinea sp. TaxID=2293560 RepID=UPI002C4A8133|nr:metal-dependent hydrolase [Anaerolineales bacterium]HQY95076.1 metal-dependent hydrolase [Caldilinea sp.]HRA65576.1 metal-dependent hydrolase [Caldilinea sp.]